MESSDALPTGGDAGASPEDRLEALLSASDAPEQPSTPLEANADVPAEESEKTDAEETEGETPEYQLADVAEMLGADASQLDVDDSGKIVVVTKIEGVEERVKLADLIKGHQLKGFAEKQVREVAESRKALQEQTAQAQQQWQIQQAVIGQIAQVKAIESELAQYQGLNWNALIDSDPVQAVKLDRQMRDLQQKHAQATGEVQQAVQSIQQQRQHQSSASLESERQALLKAIPDWSDAAAAEKDRNAIKADLISRGYTEADIQGLSDHKAVLLARDAMLYRAMKEKATTAIQQVRLAPKIIKPGSTQSASRLTAVQKARAEVRSSGTRQSVEDYLLKSGKV